MRKRETQQGSGGHVGRIMHADDHARNADQRRAEGYKRRYISDIEPRTGWPWPPCSRHARRGTNGNEAAGIRSRTCSSTKHGRSRPTSGLITAFTIWSVKSRITRDQDRGHAPFFAAENDKAQPDNRDRKGPVLLGGDERHHGVRHRIRDRAVEEDKKRPCPWNRGMS